MASIKSKSAFILVRYHGRVAIQRLLFSLSLLCLILGCSSSSDTPPQQSALVFMSEFVGELDQFARAREELRQMAGSADGEFEANRDEIRAALREMDQIAREAAKHFTALGVFDGSDTRLSYAVSRALCGAVWLRYPEDQGNVVTLLRGDKGVTSGLHWETVTVEPLSEYGGDKFTLCLVARDGAWKIFTPPYTAEFSQPLQEVGYQFPEFLGHERRWMRGGQLQPGTWEGTSAIMRLQWRGEEQGVYVEWKSQNIGAEDDLQNGGCEPSRIAEQLKLMMIPRQEEAVLLCDGDLPLSFLKDVLVGLEGQSWDLQVLIPGPLEGVVYAVPVRLQLQRLGGGTLGAGAEPTDPYLGDFDFSATQDEDGRVLFTLAQTVSLPTFESLVPYMQNLPRQ